MSSRREQVKVHLRRAAGSGQELSTFGAQAQDQSCGGTTKLGSAWPSSMDIMVVQGDRAISMSYPEVGLKAQWRCRHWTGLYINSTSGSLDINQNKIQIHKNKNIRYSLDLKTCLANLVLYDRG